MTLTAATVFRDYETDGDSSSGAHKVQKSDARTWGLGLERGLTTPLRPETYGAVGDGATNDTAAMIAVVAAAVAAGAEIYLAGTYLTASSIPSLHAVGYTGPGAFKRGSDVFTPRLRRTGTNRLYVDTAGNSANDGLSAATAMTTGQLAVDALVNYGQTLKGTWRVVFAAGTWTDGIYFPANLSGGSDSASDLSGIAGRIVLQGPDVLGSPNVPTAIISGASSPTTNYGLLLNGRNSVLIQDIKFSGWNATPDSTYGINFTDFCNVYCKNVHYASCGVGVVGRQSRFYQAGGITSSCSSGMELLNSTIFSITGHNIHNCSVLGLNAAEGSSGHFDSGTIDTCVIGAYIVEQAHCQMSGTISNNTAAGIQVSIASSYFDAGLTFTTNTINVLRNAASFEVNSQFTFPSPVRVSSSSAQQSVTGTTTETVLYASIASIPSGVFQTADRSLTVKACGSFGNNQGSRTFRLKAGGTTVATVVMPGDATVKNGDFDIEFVWDAQSMSAQVGNATLHTAITPYYASQRINASAINMASGLNVVISLTVQLASAADQVVIDRLDAWLT